MPDTLPVSAPDDADLLSVRAGVETLRAILRAAVAGILAGVLVGGIGGRIVMRLAAAVNPEAVGFRTENGNLIGDMTFDGTLALMLFGGLFSGMAAAVVWAAVAAWIPGEGVRRALLTAPVAVALAGVFLVRSTNPDFAILSSDLLVVGMLLGLVAIFGFCVPMLDDWIDRRLPRPGVDPRRYGVVALIVVSIGSILVLPLTIASYFGGEGCRCAAGPVPLGLPLAVAGGATVVWWVQRLQGRSEPSFLVRLTGQLGLLAATGLGLTIIVSEISALPM